MFLSRILFSRTPVLAGLVVAGLLWAAQPASAQAPNIYVSKFDRANAGPAVPGGSYVPGYAAKAPTSLPAARTPVVLRPAVGPLMVTIQYTASPEPVYVTLRGPNGEIDRHALENGPESIQTRTVIVRQGGTASFSFAVAAPPK